MKNTIYLTQEGKEEIEKLIKETKDAMVYADEQYDYKLRGELKIYEDFLSNCEVISFNNKPHQSRVCW